MEKETPEQQLQLDGVSWSTFKFLKSIFTPPAEGGGYCRRQETEGKMVELGDLVQDVVSGFKGVVVAKHLYLQGCTRVTVQPTVGEDGRLPGQESFDEPQLDVVGRGHVARRASAVDPGGPDKHVDGGRSIDKRQLSFCFKR